MERLRIAATQGKCTDILGIDRLPAHRYLGLLRIIRAMPCWNKRLDPDRQHLRGILAVPFLPLSKVHLQAVEPREIPRRTRKRNPYFLVDSPHVPVHLEALAVSRADRVKRRIERITIAGESRRVVFGANSK